MKQEVSCQINTLTFYFEETRKLYPKKIEERSNKFQSKAKLIKLRVASQKRTRKLVDCLLDLKKKLKKKSQVGKMKNERGNITNDLIEI